MLAVLWLVVGTLLSFLHHAITGCLKVFLGQLITAPLGGQRDHHGQGLLEGRVLSIQLHVLTLNGAE